MPSFYAGGDFRFKVEALELPPTTPGVVLESTAQVAVVFPPVPSFVDAFRRAARDPGSYDAPWTISLASHAVQLACARNPQGDALISVLVDPNAEPARWRQTLAHMTRVRWGDTEVTVIVAGRVFGQLGRVATLLSEERRRGPLIGVARGNVFGGLQPELKGVKLLEALDKLGLRYSAVSSGELDHWEPLSQYRRAHPDGVQFLSANLVYSSAPAVSLLPPSAVVAVGGIRVALVGLTPRRAAKYLGEAGLDFATVRDPLQTLHELLPALRRAADAVVVLTHLDRDDADLAEGAHGVDLLLARDLRYRAAAAPPAAQLEQKRRAEFHPPLWTMSAYGLSLDLLEADVSTADGLSDWSVRERHRLLDDSVEPADGWPEFDPQTYGITFSTEAALLPSARALFPPAAGPQRTIASRDFWSLAAGLGAEKTGAELGLLRSWNLPVTLSDAVTERVARVWLNDEEPAVIVRARGAQLRGLLAQADAQRAADAARLPDPPLPFTYGGVDPGQLVHGAPLEDGVQYKVFTSRVLADALGLTAEEPPRPLGRTVDDIVLDALRERAGAPPEAVRGWMEGKPAERHGLWRVNFRDVGLNLRDTHVVRDEAFDAVPNSRIQGFDEILIGGVFKTDADWLNDPFKWSNTLELEYARSRIHPRGQDPVTNTTANRISFLTTGTRRAGGISRKWLAQSWGPSLGFQFESQFVPDPGLPRKQIYSAYPGVQFYDGSWIKSLELSANIKRDLSRIPPNTQPGLHARALLSHDIAAARTGAISLQGEWYANYFFTTGADTIQDLRVEGDANFKLRVPIRKYLSVAPFVDFYYFELKTRPLWGYSAMTGIQIGFSRLWKPQFEPLLGER